MMDVKLILFGEFNKILKFEAKSPHKFCRYSDQSRYDVFSKFDSF